MGPTLREAQRGALLEVGTVNATVVSLLHRGAHLRVPGRAIVGLGVAVLGAVTLLAVLDPDVRKDPYFVVLAMTIAWGYVGAGLYASMRRPDSRVGLLMMCVGISWIAAGASLSMGDVVFSAARFFSGIWVALLLHVLMAFPSGRIQRDFERRTIVLAYISTTVLEAAPWLFATAEELCRYDCPTNLLLLGHDPALALALKELQAVVAASVLMMGCIALTARWRASGPTLRYVLKPVVWFGVPTMLLIAAAELADGVGAEPGSIVGLQSPERVMFSLLPFAVLAGLLRSRLYKADIVAELGRRLRHGPEPGRLEAVLAETLQDPSLRVAYWLPEDQCFVDGNDDPVELSTATSARAATVITDAQRPVAALIYDSALPDAPDVARLAGDATVLWLENERLHAELRTRITQLRRSRSRLVQAADAERRRIERDLHDGAQQRLASLLLHIKHKRLQLAPAGAAAVLDDVERGLVDALEELRRLAAGVLPPVLADRGLAPAVLDLAARTPVQVDIVRMPQQRLPPAIEIAAYFVIAEAVTNVVKHAHAGRATVGVSDDNGHVVIEVADDGRGGAGEGSGLRGLADRVAALDGHLAVESPPGHGTRLRAEIPCAS